MDRQIPEEVSKELDNHLASSIGLSTVKCLAWEFEVSIGSASTYQYSVDLLQRTCSCREFQLLKIICHGVEYKKLVDNAFKKTVWVASMSGVILPVLDPDDIFVPEEIWQREVFPPKSRRHSRRPLKKRILSTGEYEVARKKSRSNKCGRCGKGGHNRVTCREPLG
ncbi:hypothetical protein V5N11_021639 [Cardamine amara subsp. amara]|uniref:SWIM-type domain-containing protein n=1 Tax=Cardamine amara subsp. amara TaxID=228776 RepID=A0ABD0ZXI8_CARAN